MPTTIQKPVAEYFFCAAAAHPFQIKFTLYQPAAAWVVGERTLPKFNPIVAFFSADKQTPSTLSGISVALVDENCGSKIFSDNFTLETIFNRLQRPQKVSCNTCNFMTNMWHKSLTLALLNFYHVS